MIPAESKHSHRTEYYAVMASLVGPPGQFDFVQLQILKLTLSVGFDLPVITAAQSLLETAGLPLVVKTGTIPFDTTVSYQGA